VTNGPDDLVIRGLEVGYGRNRVIHGVGLTVPAGRRVSLLGANGAGKSTILRTLSGLLRPRAGSIEFGGREIGGSSAAELVRLGIVQVPEGRRVFPALSVEENLRLAAYKRPPAVFAEGRDRAYRLFPALVDLRHRPAGLLSGGQQQMLALGRAVVARPRLLMLDEMSLGLAPILVKDFYARLDELFGTELTLLMVEQNAQLALAHSTYFYVLRNGLVQLEGPTASAPDMSVIQAAYLGTAGSIGDARRAPGPPDL
jgi:branched-chain amino acid transport system ATP-binding protein